MHNATPVTALVFKGCLASRAIGSQLLAFVKTNGSSIAKTLSVLVPFTGMPVLTWVEG